MSTTFAVKVPSIKTYEDGEEVEVEVAFRSNGMRWLDPLAHLLPDDLEVIPIDNSHQGVYTIGDIKKQIAKSMSIEKYHYAKEINHALQKMQQWYCSLPSNEIQHSIDIHMDRITETLTKITDKLVTEYEKDELFQEQ